MRGAAVSAVLGVMLSGPCAAAGAEALAWSELPPMPPAPGQAEQIGVAGALAGVCGGRLLVAGGANFPDGLPWMGAAKVWHDQAYLLERGADGRFAWRTGGPFRLPRPLAYGVSVTTGEGVVCIGGCDADRCYPDVFLVLWDPAGGGLASRQLPPLPRPLAFMAGAKVGDVVYVAGGQETMKDAAATKHFFALDLAACGRRGAPDEPFDESAGWQELPPWPGPPRILAVAAAQSDGAADCFYLFSGRNVAPGAETEVLTDGYKYNPASGRWRRLGDVAPGEEGPCSVMAASAAPAGANHILVFGGSRGGRFVELERLDRAIRQATDPAQAEALTRRRNEVFDRHPGFSRDVLAYHTVTDTWVRAGELPDACPVTTTAVPWGGRTVIPSGEVRPGVRTPKVWAGDAPPAARTFGGLDYAVLAAYLVSLVAMGAYLSRREKTTDDFFRAGRRVPWWAAGLSIYGTQLSAITFMAIPAKTFATDWRYFMLNMTIVLAAPLIVFVFLPFYRRLDITTAYEYLERRFNLAARWLGSLMFVLLQLGRIGIILFLPSIALNVVTGIDVRLCIVVMALLSIAYTVLGGIEAVIWTDVLQVAVLLGGAWLCVILMMLDVPGGVGGLAGLAAGAGKFHAFDFRFDLSAPTFWVVVLGGLAANLISYGSDQAVIQRYLTTRDERSAARGIWTNAVLVVPGSLLFFGIGTALWAFFRTHPGALRPTLADPDAIFPWYIVTQLPRGLAGLLVAALFAAAMSSLDSSMNSVATAVTTDFYRRLRPEAPDRRCLALARWITVLVGLAGMAFALLMTGWQIKSLWDQFSRFLGLFAGGLGGLFLLGVFTRRTHGAGAVAGLVASGVVQYLVQEYTSASVLLYTFTGVASCVATGYAASLAIPARARPIDGLTLWTPSSIKEPKPC